MVIIPIEELQTADTFEQLQFGTSGKNQTDGNRNFIWVATRVRKLTTA